MELLFIEIIKIFLRLYKYKNVDVTKRKTANVAFSTPTALLKQMTGIEPASPAWEAGILPMNYICISTLKIITRFVVNCKSFLVTARVVS